jgi:hypothetical protein
MTTSQRNERRGRFQLPEWWTLGNASMAFLVTFLLLILALLVFAAMWLDAERNVPVMALYTPSSDTFAPRSDTPSSKMPLPSHFLLSPALAPVISHQKKPGDL